ncbi:Heparan-sulfate 6-O-sulfotransferase [Aphelenchoides besseyi]|nr:Heparan-sulfate 6-O-sulfotransferase [Aphelenchoides besseyi]
MVVLDNRAKPSIRCSWPTIIICGLCGLFFLLLLYYLINTTAGSANGVEYSTSLSLTTRYSVEEMQKFALQNAMSIQFKPSLYDRSTVTFNRLVAEQVKSFDVDSNDVLVFLHIQKTAGTSFEKFLVSHLNITRPCICNDLTKRCRCSRPRSSKEFWLFSRYSTGWYCGLHADWTEMSGCVERAMDELEKQHQIRRYFYTTFLRNPIERFISEYRHVERGANWLRSRHICNGRRPTVFELPLCYDPSVGWKGVSLAEYLSCPYNLAFNRQTRMLADLSLVHCYDLSAMPLKNRERILLASAKNNLRNMAFFGIKERMADSQEMFERVFNLQFTQSLANWNKSKSADTVVTPQQMKIIREHNHLDLELYNYAVKLFEKRLATIRKNSTVADSVTTSLTAHLTLLNTTGTTIDIRH